jgi:hypothetical protein
MSRIETGAYQFGDDWTGLFIRGDDCIWLYEIIHKIRSQEELNIFDLNFLSMLSQEINNNVLHNKIKE